MERASTFAQRLKEYMVSHNDMTYEELSKITGVPAQTLNRYVLGQRIPKIDAATDIATKLNIHPLWLQGYNIDNEIPTVCKTKNPESHFSSAIVLTPIEEAIIDTYRKCSVEGKTDIQGFVDYTAIKKPLMPISRKSESESSKETHIDKAIQQS
jgi:transcriptional regulator with XRE-family HTH domain